MNTYRVTVKHDKGQVNITTVAQDSAAACEMVMAAEGCPARAIVRVEFVPPSTVKTYDMNTPKGRLQYLRDSALALLRREMHPLYVDEPKNWKRVRVAGIQSHLNRLHYRLWPDDLKMAFDACMHDAYGTLWSEDE